MPLLISTCKPESSHHQEATGAMTRIILTDRRLNGLARMAETSSQTHYLADYLQVTKSFKIPLDPLTVLKRFFIFVTLITQVSRPIDGDSVMRFP